MESLNEYAKHFTFPYKTFANKSILSANKFVPLQVNNSLSVRVKTFAKQFLAKKSYKTLRTYNFNLTLWENCFIFIDVYLKDSEFYC